MTLIPEPSRAAFHMALVLGASALAWTPPAVAQTTLWTATLTVDRLVESQGTYMGCDNNPAAMADCSSALTDDDFIHSGTTYDVSALFIVDRSDSDILRIRFDKPVPRNFVAAATLNFGDRSAALKNWVISAGPFDFGFVLSSAPNFADNDSVLVSLELHTPPVVTLSASCEPCEVSPGGEVRLKATALGPDGGGLSYRWSAEQGSFIGVTSRATARWQAPPVAGRYQVKVEAFDRRGASGSSTVEINVNSPPAVTLSCEEMCRVRQGLSVRLEATALDPDGHELSYSWSAGSGSFVGETDGATARWRAPAEAGAMPIRVDVSDVQGGSASAEVDVAVDPLSNQSAVFASYLVSIPNEDPDQVIDTYISVSNVLSAPEGVDSAGSPYEGDNKVGTLEIYLYHRDDDEPMIYETTGDSPGSGLDENGMLAPGQTYTVRLADLVGENRAFIGYGWIVGNFDGIAGTRTIINFGQGVTVHGDLTPKLSHHGAGVKPIRPLE